MKVLCVAKTLTKGGAASGARNTINALRSVGIDVVAYDGYASPTKFFRKASRFCERSFERVFHGPDTHCLKIAAPIFSLRDLVKIHKPDIVQLFDVSGNTISFSDFKYIDVPIVHRLSDSWPYNGAFHYPHKPSFNSNIANQLLKATIYDGLSNPDFLVAPSQWLANKVKLPNVCVIRNSVELQLADFPSKRSVTSNFRFGFIGSPAHDPRKGLSRLPHFFERIGPQAKKVELHIFGVTNLEKIPRFPSFVEVLKNGKFSRADLKEVYSSFDVLLCPSVFDNSPNVVTEALSFGVPVIGSSGTGMESYLSKETGFLFDFSFNDDISDSAVSKVIDIFLNYQMYSEGALEFVKSDLAPSVIGQKYLDLYHLSVRQKMSGLGALS